MKLITIDGRELMLATEWGDFLSAGADIGMEQLRAAAYYSVVLPGVDGTDDYVKGWIELIAVLLGIAGDAERKNWWSRLQLHPDDYVALKKECDWVFTKRLLVKPYDSVRVGSADYLLPDADIEKYQFVEIAVSGINIAEMSAPSDSNSDTLMAGGAGEIHAADMFLGGWLRVKEHWVTLINRKKGSDWNGDVRRRFVPIELEKNARRLAKMPVKKKVVVLRYLQDIFIDFVESYEDVFGKDNKDPRYPDGRGWLFVPKPLVKARMVMDLDSAYRKSAGEIFGWLRDMAMDAKDAEEAAKSEK